MGTPSLQPFLKTYWLTPVNDWPIVAKHANMTSSRGSINAAPATIRQNLNWTPLGWTSSDHGDHRDVSFPLSGNRGYHSNRSVPFQAVTRHHGDYSVMGTPSLQPFLKTYWLTPVNDWPIVAKHANMTSSRGSINAAPATIRQNLFLHLAEPRLWLKMVQLTVKVRSFEGRPHGCSSAAFRWVWHFLR